MNPRGAAVHADGLRVVGEAVAFYRGPEPGVTVLRRGGVLHLLESCGWTWVPGVAS